MRQHAEIRDPGKPARPILYGNGEPLAAYYTDDELVLLKYRFFFLGGFVGSLLSAAVAFLFR